MSKPASISNSTIYRRGKHVISLAHIGRPRVTPAPTKLATLEELATDSSDVELIPVESASAWNALDYHYVGNEPGWERAWPSRPCPPTTIARIKNGRSWGRHCLPISGDNRGILEFAFHVNAEKIAQSVRFGTWNPRYHRIRQRGDVTAHRRLPSVTKVPGSVAAINLYASHNFYHWMIDILPRVEALQRSGIEPDFYLVDNYQSFQTQTLRAIGIPSERIIQPHPQLLVEADELYVITRDNPDGRKRVGPWLQEALSRHAQPQNHSSVSNNSPHRIYIRRGKQSSRRVRNEQAFETMLTARGFECFQLEKLSLSQQSQLFSNANLIVGLHGAGLSNAIYAPANATVVELMPRGRLNFSYPLLSQSLGQQHWVVDVERVGIRQGVVAPLDGVAHVLDSIEKNQQRNVAA